jgi:hypothetical protein
MTRYTQRKDGEWVHWARKGHLIACCDCGLVHFMVPRVRAGRVEIRATRMPKHTAVRRRGLQKKNPGA